MNRILGPNSRICVQAQHAELALVEPELHLRLVHHGPCRLLDMARVDGQTSDVGMGIGVGRLVIQVHSKGGVGVGEDVASGDVGAWASRARRSDRRWRARRPHGLRSRLGGCLAPGEVLIGDLESARSSAVVGSGIDAEPAERGAGALTSPPQWRKWVTERPPAKEPTCTPATPKGDIGAHAPLEEAAVAAGAFVEEPGAVVGAEPET